MPPPDALQDQFAQLKGQLRAVNDRINATQSLLQAQQAERQAIQNALDDVRAAYLAWKGTQP